ncbi:MAG: hypothetical protein BRC44_08900 [Cyanobacteria bacterium QS_4_48_99]|nr:MAG: hypothetical protein BRC44_08900 [Cyanobacteria bacterium QS_4_48_99]
MSSQNFSVLSHAAERDTVGDTRGLVRRRFPVGEASQHQPASRGRSHSVRLERRFWRMLPWEFPPWQTVYGYFDPGATTAVGSAFTATYAGGTAPVKRPQSPWVAMADTHSVSLGCLTHWAGGFDGGKRVKGRKRHVLVDSMGLLLAVVVTAAKLTSKGCRLCCAGSSSGEAGSIGCGSAVLSEWCPELGSWSAPWPDFPVPEAQPGR